MSWLSKATGIHININKGTASVDWTQLRDFVESAAVLVANYYFPGSSLLTSGLTSKGSQDLLNTGVGVAAQFATGLAGSGAGAARGLAGTRPVTATADYVGRITNSTVLADATKGAIVGGAYGAGGAAARGEDIGKGALKGAEFGAASAAVGSALKGGTLGGKAGKAEAWQLPKSVQITGTGAGAQAARSGLSSFAGAEAAGESLQRSAEAGGLSALATGLFPSKEGATSAQQAKTQYERQMLQQGLSQALANSRYKQPAIAPTQATISGQGTQAQPGTAALAQALRVGDAGGPIFGSSGEEKGKKPGGWNIQSLRYMGSEA